MKNPKVRILISVGKNCGPFKMVFEECQV